MINHPKLVVFLALLLLSFGQAAMAQTAYVSDELMINMRVDKGNQYRIIKTLKSGTPLTVLKTDESGYSQVRASDGTEGWVISRFLVNSPVARDRLAAMQRQVEKYQSENERLKQELASLKQEHAQVSSAHQELSQQAEKLQSEAAHLRKVAANPLQTEQQNEQLRTELINAETQLRVLTQEHQALKDDSDRQWFMLGAAVLFGGIILGLILPKLRSQRRSSW